MFFPRQIKEALALDVSRKTVEEFAAKVRAQLLLPEAGGDVRKLAKNLGGKVRMTSLIGRTKGQDDFLVALSKNDFTVAVIEMGAVYLGDGTERADIAKALGHMLMHYPMHLKREGAGTAMVVARYPEEGDLNAQRVTQEGHWFAWTLLAPVHIVAAAFNGKRHGSEAAKINEIAWDMQVSGRLVQSQIKRARELGLVTEAEEVVAA